jgi:ATP-binding cassette subfamily F protein uup
LDVETLEALESRLDEYNGTLLVVSHDRHFLDRAVTSTLVFEGDGSVKRYAGGYSDWATLRHELAAPESEPEHGKRKRPDPVSTLAGSTLSRSKLSYKLQRELDALPAKIEELERELGELEAIVAGPGFYQRSQDEIQKQFARLEFLRDDLELKMARWEALEAAQSPAPEAG